jgi:hypothetical protein
MDCIEPYEAENRANARHGLSQVEGMGIVVLGGVEDIAFQIGEPRIIRGDACQVDRHGLLHGRLIKALGHPFAVGLVGTLFPDLGPVILAIGMLPRGQECRACAHQVGAAPEQVTGGTHLGRVDRGLREHTTPKQGSNLVGIDRVVLRFAPMDGFHVQGMSQDEGHAFLSTEVGEPRPGEETFNGDDQTVTIRGNGLEKGFWSRFHSAVQQDFPLVAQDTDIPRAGMPVDTAVKLMLSGVEAPEVSSAVVSGSCPNASIPLGYAEGEASIIIKGLEPTRRSARLMPSIGRKYSIWGDRKVLHKHSRLFGCILIVALVAILDTDLLLRSCVTQS